VNLVPAKSGGHRCAEAAEQAVARACKNLGMTVAFLSTDGDNDTDKRHSGTFKNYAEFSGSFLSKIVRLLNGRG
jgi:hypothetical protein